MAGLKGLSRGPPQAPDGLRRTAPQEMSHDELVERARRGIEFMTVFPPLVRDDSPTLREYWPSSRSP